MVKDYLINNDGGWIISEFDKTGALLDLTRKRLITNIAHFSVELFGPTPNRTQKKIISMAVIELFPVLRTMNSEVGGIVRIYAVISFIQYFCGAAMTFTLSTTGPSSQPQRWLS